MRFSHFYFNDICSLELINKLIFTGDEEFTELLLIFKANPNIKDNSGSSPWDNADDKRNIQMHIYRSISSQGFNLGFYFHLDLDQILALFERTGYVRTGKINTIQTFTYLNLKIEVKTCIVGATLQICTHITIGALFFAL